MLFTYRLSRCTVLQLLGLMVGVAQALAIVASSAMANPAITLKDTAYAKYSPISFLAEKPLYSAKILGLSTSELMHRYLYPHRACILSPQPETMRMPEPL
jgi:hypothetical protein